MAHVSRHLLNALVAMGALAPAWSAYALDAERAPAPQAACVPSQEPAPHGPPDPASPCDDNVSPGPSDYVPATLHLKAHRPYIPLADYKVAPASSAVAKRFLAYVDRAVAGNPDYGYSPADAVVAYARTGRARYIKLAIAGVDAQVKAARHAIAAGDAPDIAGDSYLEVGPSIEDLALTYDRGYRRLTTTQRRHWRAYAEQAVSNVWSPQLATWGSHPTGAFAWSGWSINNPGNNYNFSFIEATQTWALATHDKAWMHFLQDRKFPLLTSYYEGIPGGGSREGTGYGTAQGRLWANARTWAEGTGEHLGAVETHARQSIDYWINATVPTLDYFAPFGDLSRESLPELYDYQENIVREAAMSAPRTPQADRAWWWIRHDSVPATMTNSFNLRPALLRPRGTATEPTRLTYRAPGVGQLFTRTGWGTDATWLATIAGPYDESHAHAEQGTFSLYHGGWEAVTANIWSHSGLEGNGSDPADVATRAADILRFDDGGTALPQHNATSTMTSSRTSGILTVHEDLSPVYDADRVQSWTRDLTLSGSDLTVHDACTVAAGVTPVWQLDVPEKPTVAGPGHVLAGGLDLAFDPSYAVELHSFAAENDDYGSGWRIELRNSAGCGFDVAITQR